MSAAVTPAAPAPSARPTARKPLVRRFFDAVPKWTAIGLLGRNWAVRTSVIWLLLVPLVANAIEAVGDRVTVAILGTTFIIKLQLPFRLVMFYAAAVAFALGALLFKLACPAAIIRYKSYDDFAQTGQGDEVLLNTFGMLYQRPSFLWPLVFGDDLRDFFLDTFTNYAGDRTTIVRGSSDRPADLLSATIHPAKRAAAYGFIRHNIDRSRPIARLLTALAFGLGFAFLAVVFYQNAATVWRMS